MSFEGLTFRGLEAPYKHQNKIRLASPTVDTIEFEAPLEGAEGFEQLLEAVYVRSQVKAGEYPKEFMCKYGLPENQHGFPQWFRDVIHGQSIKPDDRRTYAEVSSFAGGLANVVKMDNFLDLGLYILKSYDLELKDEYKEGQTKEHIQFITSCLITSVMGASIAQALKEGFRVKYYYMAPRPIERAAGIVPADFEAYPAPSHPSKLAGHGLAARMTLMFIKKFFEADKVAEEIQLVTDSFAASRTLAFVHTMDENISGANFAELVGDKILSSNYKLILG